jgi:hypothetical protein
VFEDTACRFDRVTRSALLGLDHKARKLAADRIDDGFFNFFRLVTDNYDDSLRLQRLSCARNVRDQWPAAQLVEHLGSV